MKLLTVSKKNALSRELAELETQIKSAEAESNEISGDRLKKLALEKKITTLRREYMKNSEDQFLNAMRLDLELEQQIKDFTEKGKLTVKVIRNFVLRVEENIL